MWARSVNRGQGKHSSGGTNHRGDQQQDRAKSPTGTPRTDAKPGRHPPPAARAPPAAVARLGERCADVAQTSSRPPPLSKPRLPKDRRRPKQTYAQTQQRPGHPVTSRHAHAALHPDGAAAYGSPVLPTPPMPPPPPRSATPLGSLPPLCHPPRSSLPTSPPTPPHPTPPAPTLPAAPTLRLALAGPTHGLPGRPPPPYPIPPPPPTPPPATPKAQALTIPSNRASQEGWARKE